MTKETRFQLIAENEPLQTRLNKTTMQPISKGNGSGGATNGRERITSRDSTTRLVTMPAIWRYASVRA